MKYISDSSISYWRVDLSVDSRLDSRLLRAF